jgi:hypothetical protein
MVLNSKQSGYSSFLMIMNDDDLLTDDDDDDDFTCLLQGALHLHLCQLGGKQQVQQQQPAQFQQLQLTVTCKATAMHLLQTQLRPQQQMQQAFRLAALWLLHSWLSQLGRLMKMQLLRMAAGVMRA